MPRKSVKPATRADGNGAAATADGTAAAGALVADIIIANAPDPVFVSDLEGKIIQANGAVSQLPGIRQDEVAEPSLSRFAIPEVIERGVTRTAVLNTRSPSLHDALPI